MTNQPAGSGWIYISHILSSYRSCENLRWRCFWVISLSQQVCVHTETRVGSHKVSLSGFEYFLSGREPELTESTPVITEYVIKQIMWRGVSRSGSLRSQRCGSGFVLRPSFIYFQFSTCNTFMIHVWHTARHFPELSCFTSPQLLHHITTPSSFTA